MSLTQHISSRTATTRVTRQRCTCRRSPNAPAAAAASVFQRVTSERAFLPEDDPLTRCVV